MTESEKRIKRVCFTGHRPEKLKASYAEVILALGVAIDEAIAEGFKTFISGMSRGTDIWAAEIVLARRATNSALRLICALPYPHFEEHWAASWQARYHAILQQADLVRTISPSYSLASYQRRNEWMVDHSFLTLAVYNGEAGGTRNTIEYAKRQGIIVREINFAKS